MQNFYVILVSQSQPVRCRPQVICQNSINPGQVIVIYQILNFRINNRVSYLWLVENIENLLQNWILFLILSQTQLLIPQHQVITPPISCNTRSFRAVLISRSRSNHALAYYSQNGCFHKKDDLPGTKLVPPWWY